MLYYFDIYGWHSAQEIQGRSTEQKPPAAKGKKRPNWTGEKWVLVEYTEPAPVAAAPTAQRLITRGAFFDRFGAAKWAILADQTPLVKAMVIDATVREHINLDSPELPAGLAIVIDAGHAIDADAIIGDPVQPHEVPPYNSGP